MKGRSEYFYHFSSSVVTEIEFRIVTAASKSRMYAMSPRNHVLVHSPYFARHSVNVDHTDWTSIESTLPKSVNGVGPGREGISLPLDAHSEDSSNYVYSHDEEQW